MIMKEMDLKEMYMSMIRNAYNNNSIDELESIKKVLELTPTKVIMNNQINMTTIRDLEELINTNIVMIIESKGE